MYYLQFIGIQQEKNWRWLVSKGDHKYWTTYVLFCSRIHQGKTQRMDPLMEIVSQVHHHLGHLLKQLTMSSLRSLQQHRQLHQLQLSLKPVSGRKIVVDLVSLLLLSWLHDECLIFLFDHFLLLSSRQCNI